MLKRIFLLLIISAPYLGKGQLYTDSLSFFQKSEVPNKIRIWSVAGAEAVAVSASLLALNQLWYADYPHSDFHIYNDNPSWQQMDKIGHAMTSYYVGYVGMEMLDWAGVSHKKSLLYGGSLGFVFLGGIELLDSYSSEWGFSWGDIAANTSGMALLLGQELLWKEQRIVMKFSSHSTDFSSLSPELLGSTPMSKLLKDYNGQTYWLSFNVHDLSGWDHWPAWLNIATGYGADGMVTASYNKDFYESNPQYNWQRQYYLSLDIDLRKIPVKSKLLKAVFNAVNFVKIPMPTIEFNENDSPDYHWLYF